MCSKTSGRTLTTSAIIISGIATVCGSSHVQVSNLPVVNVLVGHGNNTPVKIDAIADTGAGACVGGSKHMKQMGITRNDLKPPPHTLQHVGGHKLSVLGVYSIYILHNSEIVETDVYFVEGVTHMYLSLGSCKKLGLVDQDFPLNNVKNRDKRTTTPISIGNIVEKEVRRDIVERLKTIPDRPTKLPVPATVPATKRIRRSLSEHRRQSVENDRWRPQVCS